MIPICYIFLSKIASFLSDSISFHLLMNPTVVTKWKNAHSNTLNDTKDIMIEALCILNKFYLFEGLNPILVIIKRSQLSKGPS